MIGDPQLDAVYLSTPIGLHAAHGRKVLGAHKHLWCEKPLAVDSEEATMLIELSRQRGVTLGEGFMYLYHHQFLYLREVLQSPRIGCLQSIWCRFGIPPLEHPRIPN